MFTLTANITTKARFNPVTAWAETTGFRGTHSWSSVLPHPTPPAGPPPLLSSLHHYTCASGLIVQVATHPTRLPSKATTRPIQWPGD